MEKCLNRLYHNATTKNVLDNLVTLGKCLQFLIKKKWVIKYDFTNITVKIAEWILTNVIMGIIPFCLLGISDNENRLCVQSDAK